MLGTYPSKPSTTNSKPNTKATKTRGSTMQNSENGPKTRSASSRRAQEQPITITYMGRTRTASDSDLAASSSTGSTRSRRPAPSIAKKAAPPTVPLAVKNQDLSSSSASSTDSSLLSSVSLWTACIEAVNQVGAVAKRDNKYIRRLKTLNSRRPNNYEKEVASDEKLTLIATRILTIRNTWSLNACHAYLPIIIDNIISNNETNRSIALNGLEAIADTWLEQIIKFSAINTYTIGVDVVAEERTEKAKNCIQRFRDVVKMRDVYYKHMDEESIFKLDTILAQLKKA